MANSYAPSCQIFHYDHVNAECPPPLVVLRDRGRYRPRRRARWPCCCCRRPPRSPRPSAALSPSSDFLLPPVAAALVVSDVVIVALHLGVAFLRCSCASRSARRRRRRRWPWRRRCCRWWRGRRRRPRSCPSSRRCRSRSCLLGRWIFSAASSWKKSLWPPWMKKLPGVRTQVGVGGRLKRYLP